jgi:hypothetical protein
MINSVFDTSLKKKKTCVLNIYHNIHFVFIYYNLFLWPVQYNFFAPPLHIGKKKIHLCLFCFTKKKKYTLPYDTFSRMVFYAIPTSGILRWYECLSLFLFTRETLRLQLLITLFLQSRQSLI